MNKTWHLSRHTFLKGVGVSLGLPLMNSMMEGEDKNALEELPRRAAFISFPHGINQHKQDHPDYKDWHWWPEKDGNKFILRQNHKYLKPYKDDISFIYGLRNTDGSAVEAHVVPTGFLTTKEIRKGLTKRNSISIDQEICNKLGLSSKTPLGSLVLSSDGGTGALGRTQTLSFDQQGAPIPASNDLKYIYATLFGAKDKKILNHQKLLLDRVLDSARQLNRSLGKEDQLRLAEYLESVRGVEKKVENDIYWAEVLNKKELKKPELNLKVTIKDPEAYVQTMYDLIYLAFKNDSTRLATYQIIGEGGKAGVMPIHLGISTQLLHSMSHMKEEHGKNWGTWDQFLSKQLSYFLGKLKNTPEADSNMLDRTMVMYGSATSWTHVNKDYPIILAGGSKMGHKSGQFIKCSENNWQLANLYVHIAQSMGVKTEKFGNSTQYRMSELFV